MKNGSKQEIARTTKNSHSKKKESINKSKKSQNKLVQNSLRKMLLKFKTQKCSPEKLISLQQQNKNNNTKKNSTSKLDVYIPNSNNKTNCILHNNELFQASKQISNIHHFNAVPSNITNIYHQNQNTCILKSTKETPRNHRQQKMPTKNNIIKNNNIKINKQYSIHQKQNNINQQFKNISKEKWKNERGSHGTSLGNSINGFKNITSKESFTFLHQQTKKNSILNNISNISNNNNNHNMASNIKLNNILIPRNTNNNNLNNICNIIIKSKNRQRSKKNFIPFQNFFMKQNFTTTNNSPNRYDDMNNNTTNTNNKNTNTNTNNTNTTKSKDKMKISLDKNNMTQTNSKEYFNKKNNKDKKNRKMSMNIIGGRNKIIKGGFFSFSTGRVQVIKEFKSSTDNKFNYQPLSGNNINDKIFVKNKSNETKYQHPKTGNKQILNIRKNAINKNVPQKNRIIQKQTLNTKSNLINNQINISKDQNQDQNKNEKNKNNENETPFIFGINKEEKKTLLTKGIYYLTKSQNLIKYIKEYFIKYNTYPNSQLSFYEFGRVIGKGAFGKVNLGLQVLTGKIVAIKSFNKNQFKIKNYRNKIYNEINLMKNLRHHSIVKILDTFETNNYILIIMENISGGDLLSFVKKRTKLPEKISKFIFKQLLQTLKFIHNKGIIHRDIKLDNILLDLNNNIKLCDFGVGKIVHPGQLIKDQCGTPAYIAPEIFQNINGYEGPPVDIWSSGVVLYSMLNGQVPFKADNIIKLHKLIMSGKFKENVKELSKEVLDLLHCLLEVNPNKRITVDQALGHPWFNNGNNNLEDNKQSLFTKAELILLSKNNIDYKNCEKQEMIENFTLENLNTANFNENKNVNTKSLIFAPFNSSYLSSENNENINNHFEEGVDVQNNLIYFDEKAKVLNRQYELNNNGEIDHGILINKQNSTQSENINNNLERSKETLDDKNIDINIRNSYDSDDNKNDEDKHIIMRENSKNKLSTKKGDSFDNNRNIENNLTCLLTNSSTIPFDENIIKMMENYGYKREYTQKCLYNNEVNYCTGTYYLLLNNNTLE